MSEREAILRPGETIYQIGSSVDAGMACSSCGASYWHCTDAVMREPHDPKASDGCCDKCQDGALHDPRTLPQIAGLIAEARAERDALAATVERVRAVCDRIENSTAIPIGWEAATRSTVSIASIRSALDDNGGNL